MVSSIKAETFDQHLVIYFGRMIYLGMETFDSLANTAPAMAQVKDRAAFRRLVEENVQKRKRGEVAEP